MSSTAEQNLASENDDLRASLMEAKAAIELQLDTIVAVLEKLDPDPPYGGYDMLSVDQLCARLLACVSAVVDERVRATKAADKAQMILGLITGRMP